MHGYKPKAYAYILKSRLFKNLMTYSELSISECIVNIKTNVIPNNKNGDIFNDHCNDNIIY